MEVPVKPEEIGDILVFFSNYTYKAQDKQPKAQHYMKKCIDLFSLDYNFSVLSNNNGELSSNYPCSIIILESEKSPNKSEPTTTPNGNGLSHSQSYSSPPSPNTNGGIGGKVYYNSGSGTCGTLNTIQENGLDSFKLKELFLRARLARCRARFPVPVILYDKKHVCRSATLSGGPEMFGRSSLDYFFSSGGGGGGGADLSSGTDPEDPDDLNFFDRVRNSDIRLLKTFQVNTIVDLMVENKKVKFGVYVTSSEKVDKENRYSDFNLMSLPYPGCEFFSTFKRAEYNAENLRFDWNQAYVDANIFVQSDPISNSLNINWSDYRSWELITLTQNYFRLLLSYLKEDKQGLLVHCISGWDRTPLFVSLIRLSLWADGEIHKSLDAIQILYLTIAYDWCLFGHNLPDRLNKGEDILFFCFYFLKHLIDSEFSIIDGKSVEIIPEPLQPQVQSQGLPKPQQLSRVRNNSDIQLDGQLLLLDGYTSSDGSNWSLNSCASSQSAKSEQPPIYFPVSSSYEDGPKTLVFNGTANGSSTNSTATPPVPIHAQNSNSNSSPCTISSNSKNLNKRISNPLQNSPIEIRGDSNHKENTSPVTVPNINGGPNGELKAFQGESFSSVSTGSWQMVNGSLCQDNLSTSDPGSCPMPGNPIFSQPQSIAKNEKPNGTAATLSSCTLIEDSLIDGRSEDFESNGVTPEPDHQMQDPLESIASGPIKVEDGGPLGKNDIPSIPETIHKSDETKLNPGDPHTRRRLRLLAVRDHFYSIYLSSIGLQIRNVHDHSSSSGLGSLIGNFARSIGKLK